MVLHNRLGRAVSPPSRPTAPPPLGPAKDRTAYSMAVVTTELKEGWSFARVPNANSGADETLDQFRAVASVPTEIFVDLLAHKLIPDPFVAQNETAVQWVGEEGWIYRVFFSSPAAHTASASGKVKPRTELVLEGLDTFATVSLNGTEVLTSDNMFIPHRVDVTHLLRDRSAGGEGAGEGQNELRVTFESAFLRGKKLREKYPGHVWESWNGDESRLVVRKAQFHYVRSPFLPLLAVYI